MRFDIVTIFPEFFTSILAHGVARRAIAAGRVQVLCHGLRQFAHDRHRTVDDRPFGGGEGMVLKPEPFFEAVQSLGYACKGERDASRETVILLSPQGERFNQSAARRLAGLERVALLCGRYEGVDERVAELVAGMELSIGDYVLSGGELAASVVVDTVMRLIPGVLGNEASSEFESFGVADASLDGAAGTAALSAERVAPRSTHAAGGLLDYPHYTRPADFMGAAAPAILSGGNHEQIRQWRRQRALEKTLRNRPDLLEHAELSSSDRQFLDLLQRRLRGSEN